MADSQDNAQRPRPFVPTAPPFRGPATAARPAATPFTPPDTKRAPAPAPFVARRESRPTAVPAQPAPAAQGPVTPTAPAPTRPPSTPQPASVDPHRTPDFIREAVAASAPTAPAAPPGAVGGDAHLYGHDPFASAPAGAPATRSAHSRSVPGEDAAPEEAAQALAGLPYFDEAGGAHSAEEPETERKRTSGKVHRVEQDPAAVLESLALRVRSGGLAVSGLDAGASEAATLAAVLAALLRDAR